MKKLAIKYAWLLAAVLVILGYFTFFRTAEVSGSSMEPTYSSRDLLLMRRFGSLRSGDIVAIYNQQLNELLCKRIIGVAGDHIVVDNEGLKVNGVLVAEDYTSTPDWYMATIKVDLTVPDGEVFVMGDNRIASNDSRALGCMSISDLAGVVIINTTKVFGIRRDTLIRFVVVLLVASLCVDIYKRLHKVKVPENTQ